MIAWSVESVVASPIEAARHAADVSRQIVVLKSGYTTIARPDGRVWIAPRATPELATAGTGDVLAGLIGGLSAQGLRRDDAAKLAVYVGAMAGKRARAAKGTLGVVARDVIELIPRALAHLAEPNWDLD